MSIPSNNDLMVIFDNKYDLIHTKGFTPVGYCNIPPPIDLPVEHESESQRFHEESIILPAKLLPVDRLAEMFYLPGCRRTASDDLKDYEHNGKIRLGPFPADRLDGQPNNFGRHELSALLDLSEWQVGAPITPSMGSKEPIDHEGIFMGNILGLPRRVQKEYQDAIQELKGYIEKRYDGILPSERRFVQWFIENYRVTVVYVEILISLRGISRKPCYEDVPDPNITPRKIEEALHRYCAYRKNEQDAIYHSINHEYHPIDAVVDSRKNIFNSMPLLDVEEWFMQLATNENQNGRPFLTAKQVKLFIGRAFEGHTEIPKQTLNYGLKEKLATWKLFYQYYQRCVSINNGFERAVQCRDKYIRLLTDNLTNFDFNQVKANFSKSNQVSRDWNLPI